MGEPDLGRDRRAENKTGNNGWSIRVEDINCIDTSHRGWTMEGGARRCQAAVKCQLRVRAQVCWGDEAVACSIAGG